MTEIGEPLHEQFAANLHPSVFPVTRAAAIRPKLASVNENWIARRMMIKRILMLATVILLLALGAGTTLAQSGYDLFQKALVKERAVGDVEEALRLYQRIVKEFAGNHALAAKAQLRMGLLYDRLGRKADAQRAYQAVVSQYADQTNEARQAQAKIVTVAAPRRNINANAKTTTGLMVRQVWAGPGREATISSDGHYLAYMGLEREALYLRDLLTKEDRRLTIVGPSRDVERIAWGPSFSADGKMVAYGRYNKDHTDLVLIPLDGSTSRVLYRSKEGEGLGPFGWSADGNHILGGQWSSGTRHIVLVSVADGSVRLIKTLDSNGWDPPRRLSLSPDGRYVVYDSPARKDSPEERDIFLLSIDGGREVPLVTQVGDDRYPVWTPDGRGILFLSQRAGSTGAWFLRVVDGKPQGFPELVKRDMGQFIQPIGFARNGSFYYRVRPNPSEIYMATIDPASGTITAQPSAVTRRLVTGEMFMSPDGRYLAYTSQRPSVQGEVGAEIIVIRSLATGEEYELAQPKDSDLLSWSPDGGSLLVDCPDKAGQWGLCRIDARTGDIAPLFYNKPGEGITQPRFLSGKSIVFIRTNGGRYVSIVMHDLDTGLETELYRPLAPFLLGHNLKATRDGQRLAFFLEDQNTRSASLMIMTPGEKPHELGPRVKYPEIIDGIPSFTPDGRYLLFGTYDRESVLQAHKTWRIAVANGSRQELRLPSGLNYLSFHPDGRQIAFTTDYNRSEVWMMDNFLPATQTRKATASRR
jgi:Tol biopolymer transport system component